MAVNKRGGISARLGCEAGGGGGGSWEGALACVAKGSGWSEGEEGIVSGEVGGEGDFAGADLRLRGLGGGEALDFVDFVGFVAFVTFEDLDVLVLGDLVGALIWRGGLKALGAIGTVFMVVSLELLCLGAI